MYATGVDDMTVVMETFIAFDCDDFCQTNLTLRV